MATDESLHPLEHEWVLWQHAGGTKDPSRWKDNMKQLCKFSTIEDFWRYFNHIPKPADVFYTGDGQKLVGPEGSGVNVKEFSLFKRGIEPEWGDPGNCTGGEWFCRQPIEPTHLNLYWQNLVIGVIGNAIDDPEIRYVNGARVVDKGSRNNFPLFRLELWISTKDVEVRNRLKTRLMEVITEGCPPPKKGHLSFDWKDHTV